MTNSHRQGLVVHQQDGESAVDSGQQLFEGASPPAGELPAKKERESTTKPMAYEFRRVEPGGIDCQPRRKM